MPVGNGVLYITVGGVRGIFDPPHIACLVDAISVAVGSIVFGDFGVFVCSCSGVVVIVF